MGRRWAFAASMSSRVRSDLLIVPSENRPEASASNHDRLSSIFRADGLMLSRRTNQPARSWPVFGPTTTRAARHLNPCGAKACKISPPGVWPGQLFSAPRLRQAHRPERASTNHIQMSGNVSDVPCKSGKARHQNRYTAAQKPCGGLFRQTTVQVQPAVWHCCPCAVPRRQTRRHCTSRTWGKAAKQSRLEILYSSRTVRFPSSPRQTGRGMGRGVRSLRIFSQFHRHKCFGYFRCNSDLIRG